jgi:hypothetical protein
MHSAACTQQQLGMHRLDHLQAWQLILLLIARHGCKYVARCASRFLVCGVQVGAAAAKFQHGVVAWPQCAALVLGAICIIAWLNLR